MEQILINNQLTTYFITEEGKLFNKKTNHWLKGTIHGGYLIYSIHHKNKKYDKLAHRLVAEAYIPNPNNLPMVNHIDGNKLNNNKNNLEWVNALENLLHAYSIGLKEKSNHRDVRIKYEPLEDEIWLPYKDTTYMVSNKGRMKNNKTGNIMKGKITKDGYVEWHLSFGQGKSKSCLAHRIIYEVFNGEIFSESVINHIDGNKTNNLLYNLEMITLKENVIKSYYDTKTNKLKTVGKYSMNDELLAVYPSCAEAARLNLGCLSNYISRTCLGKQKSHHGYKWKYIDEE